MEKGHGNNKGGEWGAVEAPAAAAWPGRLLPRQNQFSSETTWGVGTSRPRQGRGKRAGQVFICCHMQRQGTKGGGRHGGRTSGKISLARCLSDP
jgi:hypothetical protein